MLRFYSTIPLVVFALSCVAGCGEVYRADTLYTYPHYDESDRLGAKIGLTDTIPPLDLSTYRFLDDDQANGPLAYSKAKATQLDRNRLTAVLMERSDRIYEVHNSQVQAAFNNIKGGVDLTSAVLAGIAPLFPAKATTDALALSASLTQTAGSIYVRQAYSGLLLPKILQATALARQDQRVIIESHRNEDVAVYTVDDMLRDVGEYHRRGSFIYGVMQLAGTTAGSGAALASALDLAPLTDTQAKTEVGSYMAQLLTNVALAKYNLRNPVVTVTPAGKAAGPALTTLAVTVDVPTASLSNVPQTKASQKATIETFIKIQLGGHYVGVLTITVSLNEV